MRFRILITIVLVLVVSLLFPVASHAAFGDFRQCATAVNDVTSSNIVTIGGAAGWGNDLGANPILVLGAKVDGSTRTFTVTGGGGTWTSERSTVTVGAYAHEGIIADSFNATAGAQPSIELNVSGAAVLAYVVLCEFEGSATTAFDDEGTATGSSTTPSASATITTAPSLQIGVAFNGANNTYTAGASFTIPANGVVNAAGSTQLALEYITRGGTGAQAADFTITSDFWGAMTTSYYSAAAGAVRCMRSLLGVGC